MKPKFVKRANHWCVTWFNEDVKSKKRTQHIEWFITREEAEKFSLEKYESIKDN